MAGRAVTGADDGPRTGRRTQTGGQSFSQSPVSQHGCVASGRLSERPVYVIERLTSVARTTSVDVDVRTLTNRSAGRPTRNR